MIQGAIFDADGTLLDSMGMWETVGVRYLASVGVEALPGLRQILFPLSLAECAVYLKGAYELPFSHQAIENGINGIIRGFYCHEVLAKAGAVSFLTRLREKGIPCALATATDKAVVLEGLARTKLLPLLEGGVYTCGELHTEKQSSPFIYHTARDAMGAATEGTWVFEDAVHAAKTAQAAGYPVAGVADAYSDQEELKTYSTLYLPDLTDFDGFWAAANR